MRNQVTDGIVPCGFKLRVVSHNAESNTYRIVPCGFKLCMLLLRGFKLRMIFCTIVQIQLTLWHPAMWMYPTIRNQTTYCMAPYHLNSYYTRYPTMLIQIKQVIL
jgi:hypothetical protein